MDDITLLIPLKGRESITKKFLQSLNSRKCPFPIYIADGSQHPIEGLNTDNYLNLQIKYNYYGFDKNIKTFIRKSYLSLSDIETQLVMMVDSDDDVDLEGIQEGVDFLKKNIDYSSYRGKFVSGTNRDKVIYLDPSVKHKDPINRLKAGIDGKNSGWNDIKRTSELLSLCKKLHLSGTNDFQLFIRMLTYWHMIFGKALKHNARPFYIHKVGSTMVAGRYSKYRDWGKYKYFTDSIAICVAAINSVLPTFHIVECTDYILNDIFELSGNTISDSQRTEILNKIQKYQKLCQS